jgi:glucose/arabinose dehydrogenase
MLGRAVSVSLLFVFVSGLNGAGAQTEPARIALQPVLNGLSGPVFATTARDGSGRLFIVEQEGVIRVLHPGQAPSLFLDISFRVLSGGERGLLGLTFHPQYPGDRRFFVDYTRRPDGATVIAEYRASESDPDVADPAESILLTIAQPYENHNGGMVEFGADGYLYIGMGDGGSANDPENRAQNPNELLGKILRIDVDRSEGGLPYAIPPTNMFYGSASGRQEIFAMGLRNPWRFSFDRITGRLYAGDVGQNAVEEVDIITGGNNYGWRVLEGTRCTGLGPASCSSAGFTPPIAEYTHSGGRCSLTGGYVYRGTRGSLPQGAYVYGDYCSGEIFMQYAGAQTLLLDTDRNISSFAEDESGEIYVVGLGGTLDRIANPDAPPLPEFYFPRLKSTAGGPSGAAESSAFAAVNLEAGPASLTFTAYDASGIPIQGPGITNPATLELPPGAQAALLDFEIFGTGFRSSDRLGWVRLESGASRLAVFFQAFDAGLSLLDGALGQPVSLDRMVLPEVSPSESWSVYIANPHEAPSSLTLELRGGDGAARATASRVVAPGQVAVESVAELFPGAAASPADYIFGTATQGLAALEFLEGAGNQARAVNAEDATAGGSVLCAPQYASGGGYQSIVSLTNLESTAGTVTFRLFGNDGTPAGTPRVMPIAARGRIRIADPSFFGSGPVQGLLVVESSGPLLSGSITFADEENRRFSTTVPLAGLPLKRLAFGQIASDASYYTGLAVANSGVASTTARVDTFDRAGRLIASGSFPLPPKGRIAGLITELLPDLAGISLAGGHIEVTADGGVAAYAVFGSRSLTTLTAIQAVRF